MESYLLKKKNTGETKLNKEQFMSKIPAGYLTLTQAKSQQAAYVSKGADSDKSKTIEYREVVSSLRKQFPFKGLTAVTAMADQLYSELGFSKDQAISTADFQAKCLSYTKGDSVTGASIEALGARGINLSRHSIHKGGGKGGRTYHYYDAPQLATN